MMSAWNWAGVVRSNRLGMMCVPHSTSFTQWHRARSAPLTEGGGGVARPGGGAGGACPQHLPRGRRGSKVKGGRSPSRSDAEGALDFGGAAPYASATPPPEHPSCPTVLLP